MEALYKKLNLNTIEFKNYLETEYGTGLSQAKIAKNIGCTTECIEQYFKKFKIKGRSAEEAAKILREKHCSFSNKEIEIINGLLLSDLHISASKNQARFTFGVKHKEFADSIVENIPSITWQNLYEYTCERTPNINYFCKSYSYTEIKDLHNKWYLKNKEIPDIELTKETLYWWYLGDGYLETSKYALLLCTDSFSKESNLKMVKQLRDLNFDCYLTTRNRIRFSGNDGARSFLNYIGEPRLKCYEYKWKI